MLGVSTPGNPTGFTDGIVPDSEEGIIIGSTYGEVIGISPGDSDRLTIGPG